MNLDDNILNLKKERKGGKKERYRLYSGRFRRWGW